MSPVLVIVLVLVSGALGALARFGLSRLLPVAARPHNVPRAVLIVNVVGSFIAGVALGCCIAAPTAPANSWKLSTVMVAAPSMAISCSRFCHTRL